MSFVPYGRQDINQKDIDTVVEVLKSDYLTQGPKVPAFEKAITDFTGAKYAYAMNSATSALHIACLALEVGTRDEVWTSAISFVASSNCALYCGAKVDFVDIDPDTYNMSITALTEKLQEAKKHNTLPKVVIPVHLTGQSCDMEQIHKLSKEYGFKVIEDASHAIGAKYQNKPVGDCHYSDISIFSFHPVKIVTSAEGGVATTNDDKLAIKLDLLRSHGITRDHKLMQNESHGPWYYEQIDLGYNYRMTELQAALGESQMSRLEDFVAKRNELAKAYDAKLKELPLKLPVVASDCYSSWHLYIIRLKLDEIKKSHLQVFEELRENNIGVNLHYIPIYLQPYYQKLGFKSGLCPEAESYYAQAISIPLFSAMSDSQQDSVITTLKQVLIENI